MRKPTRPALAAVLVGVLLLLTSQTAAAQGSRIVPPFKTSFTYKRVPGGQTAWRLTRITVLLPRQVRGERFTWECNRCRGHFGNGWVYRGRRAFIVSHQLVTARSRFVIWVERHGLIGRLKEYSLRPKRNFTHLIRQECLADYGFVPVNCAATPRLNIAGSGFLFRASSTTVLSGVTGYQEMVAGQVRGVSRVKRSAYIVEWLANVGRPGRSQIAYFDAHEGGPAEAAIAVLRPQPGSAGAYQLIAQSPPVELQPYFGGIARLPIGQPLKVEPGDVVALTVPTWAPLLATGLSNEWTWQSSRQQGHCSSYVPSAHSQIGSVVQYSCGYRESELTYDAILSGNPNAVVGPLG